MKTDKEQELWLLAMSDNQAGDGNGLDTTGVKSGKFAKWAAITAVGVTTATLISGS